MTEVARDFVPVGARCKQVASEWFECPRTLKGRLGDATHARWAVYIVLHEMGWDYSRIARHVGGDASCVKHGLKQGAKLEETNPFFATGLAKLRTVTALYQVAYPGLHSVQQRSASDERG